MASGKTSKAARSARSSVVVSRPKPWGTIAAAVAVALFAAGVFGYVYTQWDAKQDLEARLAAYTPSEANQDPSGQIQGVEKVDYTNGRAHVDATQRVAYDKFPPFGGAHDATWAACNGVVYDKPVRNENMVHTLEHGAIWIAYNPDQIQGDALETLRAKVEGETYISISPYPGLDRPISVQSWGHQLKLDSATDDRIDQFIRALRLNSYQYPEVGGTCDATPGTWSTENPSPFVGAEPGPEAVPLLSEEEAATSGAPAPTGESGAPAPSGESGAPVAPTSAATPTS